MPRERTLSPLFILVAIIAVVAALYWAKAILLPFAIAVLLTFLFTPLANRLEQWGVPRVASVVLVVAFAFAILGGLGWIVSRQVMALSQEMAAYRDDIVAKARSVSQTVSGFGREITGDAKERVQQKIDDADQKLAKDGISSPGLEAIDPETDAESAAKPPHEAQSTPDGATASAADSEAPAEDAVDVRVVEMPPSPLAQVQEWLGPLLAPVGSAGLVIVLVFFMLLDRENQRDRVIQLFGTANLHMTTEALQDATLRVARYLRMMFLMNAGYGVAVTIGLALIGVPGAVMWGVLGFALRFLPYIGPWIAAAMPLLISIAVSEGWTQPMLVAGMYIVYETLLNNVAEPLLYGSSIGVSTVGVIVAAIFWTWIWGPIGLIVAMPMTVCLVVFARYVPQLHFITVLLGDQPPLTPVQRVYQRLLAMDYNEPLKLARNYLKTASLASFYDQVLIPALALAERDRHADLLNEQQEVFIEEAGEDLVEELGEAIFTAQVMGSPQEDAPATSAEPAEQTPAARVLCLPLRDRADEIAACMLQQMLEAEGFEVDSGAAESLTSEVVDRVAASHADIVVISVLPPIRPRESRLLWKRLRTRYPDLPIIVGFWTGDDEETPLSPPEQDNASKVATTLADAVKLVRATAAQLRLAKAV